LPERDQLMPNAPRPYRKGSHEGVDFYDVDSCTAISLGTPVVAAQHGLVIRADHDYRDITAVDMARFATNPASSGALDAFRGRQVWIDHGVDADGNPVVTRYCHLSAIAEGIREGTAVSRGQTIAAVGNSGTPGFIFDRRSEMHLHFELRIGDSFLGKGLPPSEVRALYTAVFGP
jgi:murein DD-endopeptidase MepM/ murein hydrolase activator NlpD